MNLPATGWQQERTMVDYAFRPAYEASAATEGRDKTRDAVNRIAQQINDRTSKSAKVLNGVAIPDDVLSQARSDSSGEGKVFRNAADYLEDNGYVKIGDHILVGHRRETLGWGGSVDKYEPAYATPVYGGVHLIENVGAVAARNVGMHELLHVDPFDFFHCHGRYWLNASDEIYLVSPMATTYTLDPDSNCDTETCGALPSSFFACGNGSTPSAFKGFNAWDGSKSNPNKCNYYTNTQPQETYHFKNDCPIHTHYLSDLVIGSIDNNMPGTSVR